MTEAASLMLRHAFALSAPSRRAAQRFGFAYEGGWHAAEVAKGRLRDTAWHSLLAAEWPPRRAASEAWLDGANCDAQGQARRRLARPAAAG